MHRELELLRLRLIEELELPHKQKAEAFEQVRWHDVDAHTPHAGV